MLKKMQNVQRRGTNVNAVSCFLSRIISPDCWSREYVDFSSHYHCRPGKLFLFSFGGGCATRRGLMSLVESLL